MRPFVSRLRSPGHAAHGPRCARVVVERADQVIRVETHAVELHEPSALRPIGLQVVAQVVGARARRDQDRRVGEDQAVQVVVAGRVAGIVDIGRRERRNVAGRVEAQLRREQTTCARVVCRDENRVDVLASPRLELDRHAEARRELALALIAARDVQETRDRLRELLRAAVVAGEVEQPPAARLEFRTERRERAPAAVAVRDERDRGLRAARAPSRRR